MQKRIEYRKSIGRNTVNPGSLAEQVNYSGKIPTSDLSQPTWPTPGVTGGKLNPDWVEILMGWPKGWTDIKPLKQSVFKKWVKDFQTGKGEQNWQTGDYEKGTPRLVAEVDNRKDRLKAIGNGQVPQAARLAWCILTKGQ